ncbi:MAG TPA: hypothetical protein VGS23_05615 [Thermoplasmata archaeon]|nr:hypothetical protein [Thermoplasmata archaeon]
MNRPLVFAIVLSAIALVFAVVLLAIFPDQRSQTAVALSSGVPLTLFTAYVIYLFQRPSFTATAEKFPTPGKLPGQPPDVVTARWTHLYVKNGSHGFLGGGTAAGVVGVVKIEKDGREFRTKWASQRNPLTDVYVGTPAGGVNYFLKVDEAQIEMARMETILPKAAKPLDVAFKYQGQKSCHISVAENFRFPGLMNPETEYGPGDYTFALAIEYGGGSYPCGRFILHNGDDVDPSSLTVTEHP